jgi:hypothetical protein
MVAVVENRTAIEGVVRAERDADAGLVELDVDVASAGPVAGFPDLLTPNHPAGAPWTLRVRRDELPAGPLVGRSVRGHAALAGPGVLRLVTQDPAPELGPAQG